MKTLNSIILLIMLVSKSYSQEKETFFTQDKQSTTTSYYGFGGPLINATIINNALGLSVGGKGGAVINKKIAFGGIGFRMVNSLEFRGDNLSDNLSAPLQMSYGAGGVFFEYIFNIQNRIHFSIPVNVMAGGVNIYDTKEEIESSGFFIIEPGVNIDIKISKSYTQSLYMSYRTALGSSLIYLEDKDIEGFSIGLIFKFGSY